MSLNDKTVAFHTLGCKLNFAETSTIARQFEASGYTKVDFKSPAEVYVINTCSVTDNADKECRYLIRKVKNQQADATVIITGCYAQLKPEDILAMKGVDMVIGAAEKFNVTKLLEAYKKGETGLHACEIEGVNHYESAYSIGDRTRAFLKVQDGCDYKCTYCTIPLARGVSRSDRLENVLEKAKEITDQGIKEIVLTGVNIGDYGKGEFGNKKHEHTFLELIQALDQVEGIERIRISSIEPNLLNNEIISFVAQSKRFVPHFHVPLQSGSNEILGRMKRRYRSELYADRVRAIKEVMPHACIGVDVIVGFPGETESHVLETYHFLNELDVSYFHVFTYSERDDTEAAEMQGAVPMDERKKRNKMLRILSEKKRQAFYRSQLGSTRPVLFEHESKDGFIEAYSDNYVRVRVPFDEGLINKTRTCEFLDFDGQNPVSVIIKKPEQVFP